MQVYAEALVEDLRATIAKSGGDFVELKLHLGEVELRGGSCGNAGLVPGSVVACISTQSAVLQ